MVHGAHEKSLFPISLIVACALAYYVPITLYCIERLNSLLDLELHSCGHIIIGRRVRLQSQDEIVNVAAEARDDCLDDLNKM